MAQLTMLQELFVQADPTLLRYASAITKQMKSLELFVNNVASVLHGAFLENILSYFLKLSFLQESRFV